jgi:hypothetical protein
LSVTAEGDRGMRAKYAVIGAAAIAGFSTAAFSLDGLATTCPAAAACGPMFGIGANVSGIVIESEPKTTIYNLVDNSVIDNSVNYTQTGSFAGATISNSIENKPTTTIYNLVDNSINYRQTSALASVTSIFLESKPTTTIYNLVDNSVNYQLKGGSADATVNNLIDSEPTTTIYNSVNNSVTLNTSGFGYATIGIFIDSEPVTTIYNLVDNSVNYLQRSVTAGAMVSNFIESEPTTTIYNLIDNSINLDISGSGYATISVFIDSEPTTIIYNLVDNSINVRDLALIGLVEVPTPLTTPEPVSLSLLGVGLAIFSLVRMMRRER